MNPLCDRYRSLVDSIKAYQSEPLDEETKRRIYDYLVNPTPTAWSDISGIIVNNRLVTVWQAVRRVDPSFPVILTTSDESRSPCQMATSRPWKAGGVSPGTHATLMTTPSVISSLRRSIVPKHAK